MVAHSFRISSACVPAGFDLGHIFADVVRLEFFEAPGNYALGPTQLSWFQLEVLLTSQSSECVRFNFCCTAANIAATSAASMALRADTDDDPRNASAARATTDGADDCPLAMAFRTQDSCWHRSTFELGAVGHRMTAGELASSNCCFRRRFHRAGCCAFVTEQANEPGP